MTTTGPRRAPAGLDRTSPRGIRDALVLVLDFFLAGRCNQPAGLNLHDVDELTVEILDTETGELVPTEALLVHIRVAKTDTSARGRHHTHPRPSRPGPVPGARVPGLEAAARRTRSAHHRAARPPGHPQTERRGGGHQGRHRVHPPTVTTGPPARPADHGPGPEARPPDSPSPAPHHPPPAGRQADRRRQRDRPRGASPPPRPAPLARPPLPRRPPRHRHQGRRPAPDRAVLATDSRPNSRISPTTATVRRPVPIDTNARAGAARSPPPGAKLRPDVGERRVDGNVVGFRPLAGPRRGLVGGDRRWVSVPVGDGCGIFGVVSRGRVRRDGAARWLFGGVICGCAGFGRSL